MNTHPPRPSPFAQITARSSSASKPSDRSKAVDPEEEDEDLEDDDEETKKAKKAKRAKKAEEDDKKDEDDSKCRGARQRERARCAAIFSSPEASFNIVATCHLAFMTSLPTGEAIRTLAALNSAQEDGRGDTTSTGLAKQILAAHAIAGGDAVPRRSTRPAAAQAAKPVNATAAAIIAADKKRRGEE